MTTNNILTESEIGRVITESLEAAGTDGLTDEEMERACNLMQQMALKAATYSLWQDNEIRVGYDREQDALRWWAVEQ